MTALADKIDALLPQTQCQRCGYPDCRAYAEAIANHETDINRCPPGDSVTIHALAELTHRDNKLLDPEVGLFQSDTVAFIDEPLCIGCTKCIQACPVDAIVGAAKQMHTIIEALCTGCELCIPPCPVDCIQMQPSYNATKGITAPVAGLARADFFRGRYQARSARLERNKLERQLRRKEPRTVNQTELIARRKVEIAAAVARVHAKRAKQGRDKP
ncbi:MAG: RnfABCDGE type electron transport complex subunit B [Gammaproteobacteria bacterium]